MLEAKGLKFKFITFKAKQNSISLTYEAFFIHINNNITFFIENLKFLTFTAKKNAISLT